ncbi:MAG: ABC transporter substrate binding protein [Lachnospiraceae bacterium]|nr:ABC transporter substrate binding protein [Lachnospiraceae bacterium]
MSRKRILGLIVGIFLLLSMCLIFFEVSSGSFSMKSVDASDEPVEEPEATKRVLVLGSYQLDWVPETNMLAGIEENLSGDVLLNYYFMDTKHQEEQFARSQLTQYLVRHEGYDSEYDLVMCMDEPAFQYVNDFHARFFNKTPVVFLAIGNETKIQASARAYPTTGVEQEFPLKETVELARSLCKNATQIVVINDATRAGKNAVGQYNELKTNFPDLKLKYLNSSKLTRETLADNLESYGEETILLYANMNEDESGHLYTMEDAIHFVTRHTKIPVFTAHEYGIGMGLLGGCVISNKEMGIRAAKIVKQILAGRSPDDIAIETASSHYYFDAKVMKTFDLSKRSMPVGSEYINDQYAWFRTYWPVILALVLAFVFTMMFIIMLMTRKSRDQARIALNTAYEASQARSNFFSRMSHEMRTPLNAIIGYAELGHEDTVDPIAAEYFRKIFSSGKYLLSVINDVLDIGKMENDKFELHQTTVPLARLARHVNEMIEPLCKTHRITYETHLLFPKHRQVVCDEIRGQQVLINILGNAVKYTQDGGHIVFTFEEMSTWTTYGSKEEHGVGKMTSHRYGTYKIIVSDNGCGIKKEALPHIFDAFVSADQQSIAGRQVTGLGLAITKKIIDLAHGTISVDSEPGQGSTFTILIDFPIEKDETEEEAEHDARADEATYSRSKNDSVRSSTGTAVVLPRISEGKNAGASEAEDRSANGSEENAEAQDVSSGDSGAPDQGESQDNEAGSLQSAKGGKAGEHELQAEQADRAAEAAQISPAPARKKSKSIAVADFEGMRLLLVEDNDLNADIETILFQRLGFTVVRAANGEEGYMNFRDNPPYTYDVVIMDLLMPVLDGFGATEAIRALDREDAWMVPIVAMSASVQKEDMDHAMQVGMSGTLGKPIDKNEIVRVLRQLLIDEAE